MKKPTTDTMMNPRSSCNWLLGVTDVPKPKASNLFECLHFRLALVTTISQDGTVMVIHLSYITSNDAVRDALPCTPLR